MKRLITHIRPHLDDICALWLFKRYLPEAKDAEISFVATNAKGGDTHDDADTACIGVGRGKYDEHKGDIDDCSTTLVWKDILTKVQFDPAEQKAVQKIVDWAFLEDTGRLGAEARRSFAVPAMIEGFYDGHSRDSLQVTVFGFTMLDAIVVAQRNEVKIENAWATRKEFTSRYGKTVAVVGDARGLDAYAYGRGFDLIAIMDTSGKYHTYRANATSTIDLTTTRDLLAKIDPTAEWYFHHSKKMLICGGDHSPHTPTSKLSFEQFIEAIM